MNSIAAKPLSTELIQEQDRGGTAYDENLQVPRRDNSRCRREDPSRHRQPPPEGVCPEEHRLHRRDRRLRR